jgi:hypothetical protein
MRALRFLAVAVVVVIGVLPSIVQRSTFATGVESQRIALNDNLRSASNPNTSQDVYYKTEGIVSGPPAPSPDRNEYPSLNLPSPFNDTRLIVWFLAQQHLYFGGFVLGVLFLVMIFELIGLMSGAKEAAQRYDGLAFKMLGLIILAFSLTAISGGLLLFGLLALYPHVITYLTGVFRPFFLVYGLLFLALSLIVYFYYYSWQRMTAGFSKWIHATVGVLINVIGTAIMFLANSWGSFMMSPAGVDDRGRFLGNYWNVLHNALWNPLNVHRFLGNIILGAAVMAGYAAYSTVNAKNRDERAYHDWMGYLSFLTMVFVFFAMPFTGYWLHREIYGYRQQMGITLVGGLLAWLGIILVILIGLIFGAINYYIWQRIDFVEGAGRYRSYAKYAFVVLSVSVLVYITPHTLVTRPNELTAIGGKLHPVVGNFGVESSKQPAVYMMIVVTMGSWLTFWRSRYESVVTCQPVVNATVAGLFVAGIANIIWLGIYGYYIPANVRVGLNIPLVVTAVSIILFGSLLTFALNRQKKPIAPANWGNLPDRGCYALLFIAIAITWILGLAGYERSAVRLYWHFTEIMRDNSPWGFTYPVGFAANMITANALIFWCGLLFLFWLQKRRDATIKNAG